MNYGAKIDTETGVMRDGKSGSMSVTDVDDVATSRTRVKVARW